MANISKRDRITGMVEDYIEVALRSDESKYSLNVASVAEYIGCSRTTIYKYDLDELIHSAYTSRKQLTATDTQQKEDKLKRLRVELAAIEERNKNLIALVCVMEGNAARLGINPEDLHRPLVKPFRKTYSKHKVSRRAPK
jgi:hypothetical protein